MTKNWTVSKEKKFKFEIPEVDDLILKKKIFIFISSF